ncbi:unnamed protein product [Prorocentrum cordatum]|uniref:Uncharacterized protein n=1 Tax=Prorocentrum cordatum TaxID=2364126 RepID=A0ABN9TCZ8_9DINO|nr:unnamed protein product [Polarella glacialis]
MPSQLVLSVRERATPGLSRGWRTPDPSPTRSSKGLPHCGASSWEEVSDPFELSAGDARDSSPDRFELAAGACSDAAPNKQGGRASGLQLALHIDDHELMEATTPRGHDQKAWGAPGQGVFSHFYGDCSTSAAGALPPVARAGATPDAAWGRPEKPPQWMPGQQRSPPPVAWAGATPDAAWGRIRTPSPGARPLAPHAPPAWSQGMAEKLPQRMGAADPSGGPRRRRRRRRRRQRPGPPRRGASGPARRGPRPSRPWRRRRAARGRTA